MSKIEKDLYKLDDLEGFDGDVYIKHFKDVLDGRDVFNVYYQGNKIGNFKLSGQRDYVSDAIVLPAYRRKGIASSVYNFIEKFIGKKLKPSPMYQTQDGKDFWNNRGFKEFFNKEELKTHKTWIRSGDTQHVLIASSKEELDKLVKDKEKKLLRANGHALHYPDGSSTWIIDETIHPYVWHNDGNRVKGRRVRYYKDSDGGLKKTILKNIWVSP